MCQRKYSLPPSIWLTSAMIKKASFFTWLYKRFFPLCVYMHAQHISSQMDNFCSLYWCHHHTNSIILFRLFAHTHSSSHIHTVKIWHEEFYISHRQVKVPLFLCTIPTWRAAVSENRRRIYLLAARIYALCGEENWWFLCLVWFDCHIWMEDACHWARTKGGHDFICCKTGDCAAGQCAHHRAVSVKN